MTAPHRMVTRSVAVYDGRRHVGELCDLANGQYEARDGNGERLGPFDSREDARRSLWLQARPQVAP